VELRDLTWGIRTAHAAQVFSCGIGNLTFAAAFFARGAERGSTLATEGFF